MEMLVGKGVGHIIGRSVIIDQSGAKLNTMMRIYSPMAGQRGEADHALEVLKANGVQ